MILGDHNVADAQTFLDNGLLVTSTGGPAVAGTADGQTENVNDRQGVVGASTWGTGVAGYGRRGVSAFGSTEAGIYASSTTGPGVHAVGNDTQGGFALLTDGRLRFRNYSGRATVPVGERKVTFYPGVPLWPGMSAIATVNGSSAVSVERVAIDRPNDQLTVFLTKPAPTTTKVAWLLLG